jgi:hypothetical protein
MPSNPTLSRRVQTTQAMGQRPNTAPAAPHIDLGSENSPSSLEWLKWLMLALVAILSAVIAMFLFPRK